eukprot:scaffold4176_cov75-Skeletonema_menzelii.AAC.3
MCAAEEGGDSTCFVLPVLLLGCIQNGCESKILHQIYPPSDQIRSDQIYYSIQSTQAVSNQEATLINRAALSADKAAECDINGCSDIMRSEKALRHCSTL